MYDNSITYVRNEDWSGSIASLMKIFCNDPRPIFIPNITIIMYASALLSQKY